MRRRALPLSLAPTTSFVRESGYEAIKLFADQHLESIGQGTSD